MWKDHSETLGAHAPSVQQWVLCSWAHTVCSGQVTRTDRCELSMAVNFIIIQTPANTTACTDSVSLASQQKITVWDFVLGAFICHDIFTFPPPFFIFIMAGRDIILTLKEGLKNTKREGRMDLMFELYTLQIYQYQFKNNGNTVWLHVPI